MIIVGRIAEQDLAFSGGRIDDDNLLWAECERSFCRRGIGNRPLLVQQMVVCGCPLRLAHLGVPLGRWGQDILSLSDVVAPHVAPPSQVRMNVDGKGCPLGIPLDVAFLAQGALFAGAQIDDGEFTAFAVPAADKHRFVREESEGMATCIGDDVRFVGAQVEGSDAAPALFFTPEIGYPCLIGGELVLGARKFRHLRTFGKECVLANEVRFHRIRLCDQKIDRHGSLGGRTDEKGVFPDGEPFAQSPIGSDGPQVRGGGPLAHLFGRKRCMDGAREQN